MNNENDSSTVRATEEAKAVARGALPAEQPARTVVGHVPPAGDPLPGAETPVHGGADEHGSYTVINGIKTYDRPIVGAPGTTGTDDFGDFVWDNEGNRLYPNATGDGSTVMVAPDGDAIEQIDGREDIVSEGTTLTDADAAADLAGEPRPASLTGIVDAGAEPSDDGASARESAEDLREQADAEIIAANPADEDTDAEAEAEADSMPADSTPAPDA